MAARVFILFLLFSGSVSAQVEVDRESISPLVSVVDLNVPLKARKEVVEANELIAKKNWTKTIEKLRHALTIYPDFAVAYNNLAVAYAHLGDQFREGEALEKAISIDDHMSLAYLNLARMNISASDFPHAESLLLKASRLDPANATTLILLAYAELMNQHLDEAIATCHRAHSMPYAHAFAHRIAARVFEERNQVADAVAELQLFLTEEQPGPRAEGARKEIAMLQSLPRRALPTIAEGYQPRFCRPDRCALP
jgi:tetratricopeptide (TPR) repeat protein